MKFVATSEPIQQLPILVLLLIAGLLNGCAAAGGAALADRQLTPSEEVDRYLQEHPKTPGRIARAMERSDVVDGMTAEQVVVTWGEPNRRSAMNGDTADRRWIYGTLTNRDYVYFQDSTVVKVR
jgi:hypothetical protein